LELYFALFSRAFIAGRLHGWTAGYLLLSQPGSFPEEARETWPTLFLESFLHCYAEVEISRSFKTCSKKVREFINQF
jgi:hypothetical protein